ncbi:MAG TPA: DUF1801 domain-containing protein [Chitinophagaceae bacterium]|nr:DUF1801 domain-containing protein [Chitinophagaceae bacterium]
MNRKVDEFIEALPDEQRELCALIREMIWENVPAVEEKLSFKIPFYHYFGMFLYLNPAKEGIDLGFCRGKDLREAFPQLEPGNRAIVATLRIKTKKDIREKDLRQLILTAAAWNEEAKRLKIPIVKKRK